MQDKELAFPLNEFVQCTEREYFDAPGINAHGLMMIHEKSPAHYKYFYLDGHEKETTPSMELGKLMHKAIFERDFFLKNYRPEPDVDKRTIDGKAEFKRWQESLSPDSIVLKLKDSEKLMGMIAEIYQSEFRRKILAQGKSEVAIWTRDEDGILLKAKIDFLNDDDILIDLKTAKSVKPDDFMKSVANYSYHLQSSWYLHVLRTAFKREFKFAWLAVENAEPFISQVISPHESVLDDGYKLIMKAFKVYKECLTKNEWPSYSESAVTGHLPHWAMTYFED